MGNGGRVGPGAQPGGRVLLRSRSGAGLTAAFPGIEQAARDQCQRERGWTASRWWEKRDGRCSSGSGTARPYAAQKGPWCSGLQGRPGRLGLHPPVVRRDADAACLVGRQLFAAVAASWTGWAVLGRHGRTVGVAGVRAGRVQEDRVLSCRRRRTGPGCRPAASPSLPCTSLRQKALCGSCSGRQPLRHHVRGEADADRDRRQPWTVRLRVPVLAKRRTSHLRFPVAGEWGDNPTSVPPVACMVRAARAS